MVNPDKPALSKQALGKWGEEMATCALVAKGYAIVTRNWKMNHYEVDIVAMKGDRVVFVEVKTRSSDATDPVEAVNKRKRARIIASGDAYIRHFAVKCEFQFDIVSVIGTPEKYTIEHIEDAYYPPLKKYNYTFRI